MYTYFKPKMNDNLPIFQFLNILIKNYSSLPVNKLFCHSLQVQLILPISPNLIFQLTSLSKTQTQLLKQSFSFAAFFFTHSEHISIDDEVLKNIENTLIIDDKHTSHNFLFLKKEHLNPKEKVYLIGLGRSFSMKDKKQLESQLQIYLTFIEIFHAHINLKFCMFSLKENKAEELIARRLSVDEEQEDMLQNLENDDYFRLLEERASKITQEQLKSSYKVQQKEWGELISIGDGTEFLVVWISLQRFPMMKRIPVKLPTGKSKKKSLEEIVSNQLGYSIYREKKKGDTQNEEESFTTVILNFKETTRQIWGALEQQFCKIVKDFLENDKKIRMGKKFDEDVRHIERISEILEVDPALLFANLFVRHL